MFAHLKGLNHLPFVPLRFMPKNQVQVVTGLIVTDISNEGKAVARQDGLVVFIDGAVPGDVVTAGIYRKKKNFAEAEVVELLTPSPDRVSPVCEHFGTCGGCKWQNLSYEAQ